MTDAEKQYFQGFLDELNLLRAEVRNWRECAIYAGRWDIRGLEECRLYAEEHPLDDDAPEEPETRT